MNRLTLRQNLRALPRTAWILYLGTFINRFGTFVHPFLVLYVTAKGFGKIEAGLALSGYGIGHLFSSMIGGNLADRWGRKKTIVISMCSSAAAMLALSQAQTVVTIIIFSIIAGLAAELYRPASGALLTDITKPDERVFAFGMYRLAINAGFALGPAAAGFLAKHSFFYLFLGDAITSVLYALVAWRALPDTPPQITAGGGPWRDAIEAARRDRAFVFFLVASILVAMMDFQIGSTIALHVKSLGLSETIFGMMLSLNGLLIIIFELPLTSYVQRFPLRSAMSLGFLLQGIGFGLTGFAVTVPTLMMTVVIWTLGEMVSSPVSGAYVADRAPVHLRGRYMGLWTLMWSIGMTIGPSAGMVVYSAAPLAVWAACFVLGAIAAGLVLIKTET